MNFCILLVQVSAKYDPTDEPIWQQKTFDGFFERALALAVKLEERRAKRLKKREERFSRKKREETWRRTGKRFCEGV